MSVGIESSCHDSANPRDEESGHEIAERKDNTVAVVIVHKLLLAES
jgi:hypothetical protein